MYHLHLREHLVYILFTAEYARQDVVVLNFHSRAVLLSRLARYYLSIFQGPSFWPTSIYVVTPSLQLVIRNSELHAGGHPMQAM